MASESTGKEVPLSSALISKAEDGDTKAFAVCILSQAPAVAPVIQRKKWADLVDRKAHCRPWNGSGAATLWFHEALDATEANQFAAFLRNTEETENAKLRGEIYVAATNATHAMIDFPDRICEVLAGVHAEWLEEKQSSDAAVEEPAVAE